jgi:hypothetical protein
MTIHNKINPSYKGSNKASGVFGFGAEHHYSLNNVATFEKKKTCCEEV